MTNHPEFSEISMPQKKRFNLSLTGDAVEEVELLRTLLERRLKQRLSIAQVMKRLTKEALKAELVGR